MTSRLDATLRLLSEPGGDQLTADELRAQLDLGPGEDVQVFELEPNDPTTGLGHYAIVPLEAIEEWEAAAEDPGIPAWPTERSVDCRAVIDDVLATLADRLGRGALAELEARLVGAMTWASNHYDPEKGDFRVFAYAVARKAWQRLDAQVGWRPLRIEKLEQDDRDAAPADQDALARYLGRVMNGLTRQLARTRRKTIAFIRDDARSQDQIHAVVTRLLELVRMKDPVAAFRPYERVGLPAYFQVRDEVLGAIRRRERVRIVVTATDVIHASMPRPDEVLLRGELRKYLGGSVHAFLHERLSPKLRPYLDALLIELQLDDRRWGLQQRIARRMGRGKARVSEAIAAMKEIAGEHGLELLLAADDQTRLMDIRIRPSGNL